MTILVLTFCAGIACREQEIPVDVTLHQCRAPAAAPHVMAIAAQHAQEGERLRTWRCEVAA